MKRVLIYLTFLLAPFLMVACNPVTITPKIPLPTSTPTFAASSTTTPFPTRTWTPTPTWTLTGSPTWTPTPTITAAVPTCGPTQTILYSDDFSNPGTLSNYEYQDRATGNPIAVSITGGELVIYPNPATGPVGGSSGVVMQVKDAFLSHALSNYTLDFDAKMDQLSGIGNFGAAFRSTLNNPYITCYTFVLNDDPENTVPHWQAFLLYGLYGNAYSYMGGGNNAGAASPAYTAGTWAHFEVVCQGNNFACYVDTGGGSVLIYNFADGNYSAGAVGFAASFLQTPNLVHYKNLVVKSCP